MRACLPGDLALAVELIADLVRAPKFDAAELEREKSVVLSELGECHDTPDDLIGDRLFETAFAGQPIGRSVLGSEASVKAVTRDRSGRLDRAGICAVAADPGGERQGRRRCPAGSGRGVVRRYGGARIRQPLPRQNSPADSTIDRRSFEQAHWSFALPGLPAADPATPALSIFIQAVGGGMSSRLFQELREDRGLAYSIYAWGQGFADTGLFAVGCASDRDKARARH